MAGAFQKSAFANNAFQVHRTNTANADASLPAPHCEADGFHGWRVSVDASLPALVVEATGTVGAEIGTGAVDATLPALVAEAHGVVAAQGHADTTLPTLQVEAHGVVGERKRRGGGLRPLPDHFYFRPRPHPVEQPLPIGLVHGRADVSLPSLGVSNEHHTDEEIAEILELLHLAA